MDVEKLQPMLAAVPGFASRWDKFVADWSDESSLPLYIAMGDLAHYVVERYESGTTSEFSGFFAQVEQLLNERDADVTNLMVAGLFEDIQNVASNRTFGFDVFRPWLKSASLVAWDEIDEGMRRVAEWAAAERAKDNLPPALNVDDLLGTVSNPELRGIIESSFRGRKR
jgi:hypothetical protein